MHLITAEAAPVFCLEGATFTGLAAPSRGSRENAVWKVRLEPGAPAVPHSLTREEVFVALGGCAEVMQGEVPLRFEAGSALVVPAHTVFSLRCVGDLPFTAVAVLPVGAEAVIEGRPAFQPPWTQ